MRISGLTDFRNRPAPAMVPPVPTPATNASTWPPVSFQISGPVVARCIAGLAGLSNWLGMKAPSISLSNRLA
ncbi:MAG: hypothetical protein BWZ10_03234 [candidate division BRC1 bacterium ADurb.BinA364]|nr:MAG: hypothetical protein BWZ10_03234 [candidate division BRC1 bacterium ADurb.BinA364]